MLCFIQSENRVLFFEVILLFWICIFKKKSKVLELLKAVVLFMDQHLDR